jgi:apolipoprotein N-acyltransferase
VIVDHDIAHPRVLGHAAVAAVAQRRAPAVVAASAVSAVALWLSLRSGGLGWLAWVALVPTALVVLIWRSRLAVPLAFGLYLELLLVPALPFGIAEGQWGEPPVPVLVGGSPVLLAAVVAIPALTTLLWAVGFGQPWRRSGPAAAVALGAIAGPAIAWTALDFVRVKLDPAGLWGPLFVSQRSSPAGDLLPRVGPWGLTFALVAVNYAIASAIVGPRARRLAAAAVIAVVGGAFLLPAGGALDTRSLAVAAVQAGYDTTEDDRPELRFFRPGSYALAALDTIRDLGTLTHAAADRGARLVVWPEAAIWTDPRRAGPARDALEQLANEAETTVVVPYFLPDRDQGATIVVEPRTGVGRSQPKQRPMWFLGESGGNKVAPRPAAAAGTRVGTLLGVDNQDPALPAALARAGASVLASSTHDWAELAGTQRALAQFHARASGLPVIRADWRYGSAIHDAGGRLLADAGPALRRTTVVATAQPARRPTTAARLGDAPGWTAVAGVVLALALGAVRRARALGRSWG